MLFAHRSYTELPFQIDERSLLIYPDIPGQFRMRVDNHRQVLNLAGFNRNPVLLLAQGNPIA